MGHIVILGSRRDFHALHMLRACRRHGLSTLLFDTSDYPRNCTLSWDPVCGSGSFRRGITEITFNQIKSVFWSSISASKPLSETHETEAALALNDTTSMLRTFLLCGDIKWCNSWHVYQAHKVKPRQLALAKLLGARIPQTYIGNNADDIVRFVTQQQQAVYKPVYGGAHCAMVTADHLHSTHLARVLKIAPVTIQEYVAGTNIRSYVIDEQVFSGEIASNATDFREDEDVEIRPMILPDEITALAIRINQAFGMRWTAIDWRRDTEGHYYFLEANPSPMFIHFEQQTGYPITQHLVAMLSV